MTGRRKPTPVSAFSIPATKPFIDSDLLLGGSIGKQKRYGR